MTSNLISGEPIDLITLSKSSAGIGEVRQSFLPPAQFNSENLGEWVLADGRDVSNSTYSELTGVSTVPDLRGVFLRGKNNGRADGNQNPDGEKNLGEFTGDAIRNITGQAGTAANIQGTSSGALKSVAGGQRHDGTTNFGTIIQLNASWQVPTAADNRPKNVTINFYIKIGY